MSFEIQIDDESHVIPEIIIEENTKTVELFDWQRRGLKYFFDNNCKVIYEVVTGGGKTFFAIQIIKKIWSINPKARFLIVVPKNVILERTWFKELYENGISLTDIGVFYGLAKEYGKITITNMQNLHKVALEIFDGIIFDEIHNYGTKRLLPFVDYPFKYKIGLSATLERMDDKHYDIIEMFDFNVFRYKPIQALDEGVLNPFNFTNIGINIDDEAMEQYLLLTQEINLIMKAGGGFKKIMRGNTPLKFKMLSKLQKRKQLVSNYPLKFEVVKEICQKHKNDKIIVFNNFNDQTTKCYWHLLESGVRACIIHSDVEKKRREENLIAFKNDKYNVVLSSKVLDEGYNLPSIDVGIIMAGDSTARQTIQRLGRVLRKKKQISNLYQVYCCNTIEEQYAEERAKLFKELCNIYEDKIYNK